MTAQVAHKGFPAPQAVAKKGAFVPCTEIQTGYNRLLPASERVGNHVTFVITDWPSRQIVLGSSNFST